ncbi:MAG: carbohydrate ABC transporter permease [Fimbriimonadaceae bacterium]
MKRRRRAAFIFTFLAPACLLYGVFVAYPIIEALLFSMYRWRGVSDVRAFVGFENFERLFKDTVFHTTLWNNLAFLIVGGVVMLAMSLLVAHACQGNGVMSRLLRSTYLMPHMVAIVVVAIIWQFMYNPSIGLFNASLRAIGQEDWVRPWLGDPTFALYAVIVTFCWYGLGFYIMLFAAGIKGIPSEIDEAARLDGARGLTRFGRLTWPLLWPIRRVVVVHMIIAALNTFALVFLMTRGGPDRRTEVMLTYLYEQAFQNSEFGYATALAVVNLVVVLALSGLAMFLFRHDPTEARR